MDPILHYKIYKEGVDQQVILKYIKYIGLYHLYNLIKNYVWGA